MSLKSILKMNNILNYIKIAIRITTFYTLGNVISFLPLLAAVFFMQQNVSIFIVIATIFSITLVVLGNAFLWFLTLFMLIDEDSELRKFLLTGQLNWVKLKRYWY